MHPLSFAGFAGHKRNAFEALFDKPAYDTGADGQEQPTTSLVLPNKRQRGETQAKQPNGEEIQPQSLFPQLSPATAAFSLTPALTATVDMLWTQGDEHRLQQSWFESDQALLRACHGDCDDARREFLTWQVMQYFFKRPLPDLFTYGLKPDSSTSWDARKDPKSKSPSFDWHPGFYATDFRNTLITLICHPIWEGQLSLLRYALQIAAMHRVPGHIFPIAPLPDSFTRSNMVRSALQSKTEQGVETARNINFFAYEQAHPCSRPMFRLLCEILERNVKKDTASTPDRRDQTLFLLRSDDMRAVLSAINNMKFNGNQKIFASSEVNNQSYLRFGNRKEALCSWKDTKTLERYHKDWILSTRRKYIMATRHWKRGVQAPEDEPRAYDIPDGDPYPPHVYCPQVGATAQHLEMIRGLVWPLSKMPVPDTASTGILL
jgi:hypothetical protein